MTNIGMISNPTSGRVRRSLRDVRELARVIRCEHCEVTDLESIRDAADAFAEFDVVFVNSGDGTVQGALTRWQETGRRPGLIAVVPGGSTNMTAYDLNGFARYPAALERVRRLALALDDPTAVHLPRVRRSLIEARLPATAQYGFFLGAGAIVDGMRHFADRVKSRGLIGELGAGVSLVRTLSRLRDPAYEGATGECTVSAGDSTITLEAMFVLATTLERLILGVTPWWCRRDADAMKITLIRRDARHFMRRLPAVLRGRPVSGLTEDAGYVSLAPARARLEFAGMLAIDGEYFDTRADPDETCAEAAAPGVQLARTAPIEFLKL